jgi:outer membrane immunogenic protein
MSNFFTKARPRPHPLVLAASLFAATMPLACGSTAAAAADMPMKAAAAPAPAVYNWTGCYVGANGGGAASSSNFTTTVDPGSHLTPANASIVSGDGTGSMNSSNFLGGGQAGCNWQSGTLVYGLEGDLDYFHSKSQFINPFDTLSDGVTPFIVTQSLTTDFLATVRPRIGIAADRNLAYITGGVAFTSASHTQTYADTAGPPLAPAAGTGSATGSKFLTGWTAGAGWEYAWTDHWTFKAEYLFAMFGTINASGVITDAGGETNPPHGSADLTMQIIRAGVNYKF